MKNALIILLLLVIVAMASLDNRPSAPGLIDDVTALKTDADFPLCVTVRPPPLASTPRGKYDYRVGRRHRDGGIS